MHYLGKLFVLRGASKTLMGSLKQTKKKNPTSLDTVFLTSTIQSYYECKFQFSPYACHPQFCINGTQVNKVLLQVKNIIDKYVTQIEPSYTVGGNTGWHNHYRKLLGSLYEH